MVPGVSEEASLCLGPVLFHHFAQESATYHRVRRVFPCLFTSRMNSIMAALPPSVRPSQINRALECSKPRRLGVDQTKAKPGCGGVPTGRTPLAFCPDLWAGVRPSLASRYAREAPTTHLRWRWLPSGPRCHLGSEIHHRLIHILTFFASFQSRQIQRAQWLPARARGGFSRRPEAVYGGQWGALRPIWTRRRRSDLG